MLKRFTEKIAAYDRVSYVYHLHIDTIDNHTNFLLLFYRFRSDEKKSFYWRYFVKLKYVSDFTSTLFITKGSRIS